MHAATWADDIKTKEYGYTRDNVNSPTAGQNIGYSDRNQHAYWHFKDINFSPDGTPLPPPDPVDLVTQLKLMIAALSASSGASDDVRSYDLVWIFHWSGMLTNRFTRWADVLQRSRTATRAATPSWSIPASGETIALHAYWDRIFGGYSSPRGAIFDADANDGIARITVNKMAAQVSDPEAWINESAELAKQFAYAVPCEHWDERDLFDAGV